MDFDIEKSEDYAAPSGWGVTYTHNSVFLLLHGGPESIIQKKAQDEKYFVEQVDALLGKPGRNPADSLQKLVNIFLGKYLLKNNKVDICAGEISDDRLYLVSSGGISVFLFRSEKIARLVGDKSKTLVISGQIREDDKILISTPNFFEKHPPETINSKYFVEDQSHVGIESIKDLFKKVSYMSYLFLSIKREDNSNKAILVTKGDFTQNIILKSRIKVMGNENYIGRLEGIKNFIRQSTSNYGKDLDYEKTAKSRKTAAFVGICLLIILGVSIGFGIKAKKQRDFIESYQNDLSSAEHKLEESLGIYQLNPTRARELFSESKDLSEKLIQRNIKDDNLAKLVSNIEDNQGKILGEYKVSAENFVDIGLLTDNFSADKLMFTNGNIYVSDKSSRKVVKISLLNKRSEVVVGPNKIGEILEVATYGDRIFVFNSEGLFEISKTKDKLLDQKFSTNIIASGFAGNLYLLDKGSSKIFRISGSDNRFGEAKEWLTESVTVNFGNAKSMVIDGSIWVLLDNGKVYRFTQGNQTTFNFDVGLTGQLKIDSLYSNDEAAGLYVLDKSKGNVFVFTKQGEYLAQYSSDSLKDSSQMIVSEKDKRMIVLSGSKLLSLELKHLN